MGTFERRTTPQPPPVATTERTSWIPSPPERQGAPAPASTERGERQGWTPQPPPGERSNFHPSSPPSTDRSNIPPQSSERISTPPGSDARASVRATRPPISTRGSGTMQAVSDRLWYIDLPLRPGEGPFQIKGLAHRGLLHYCQHRVEGGILAFSQALPSKVLRDFFAQPFLAGSFYDILPLAAGSAVVADLTRTSLDVFAQQQGRAQATHDVQHAYRALLQGRTADDFHLRLRPLASRYYNFGEWDVSRDEKNRIRIVCRGLPWWILPWFTPMMSGYFAGLAAAMGKRHSQVIVVANRREGVAAGLPLSTIELDILLRD
jgi:hypothetical protein